MQKDRAILGLLAEALTSRLDSLSPDGVRHHWDIIRGLGDNELLEYMIANPEPSHEQHDLNRFSLGEVASSSGTENEASSHNEQGRNEIIDLDSDSEQPSDPNQHVQNGSSEESSVRTGSSVEGCHASCKRKAFEGSIGQSSSGDFHHGESSSARGQVSVTVPILPVSETAESSSRNTCVRSNPSDQQETVNPEDHQHMTDLRHEQSLGNVFSGNSNSLDISVPPVSRNMLPPFPWTEVSGESSTSTVPVERNLHLDETRPSSIPENPLFIPSPEVRSRSNATSGSLNVASSASRTGSTTGVQPTSSNPAWTPYQNLPHQQRRRFEQARMSLISSLAGSGDHPTLPSLAPLDGLVLQPDGDNSQMHNRTYSRAGLWLDRQGDSVAGAPQSFRALAAASRGRSRLTVSQMQNILDVMRRDPNHNLRPEDVMLVNQSLLFDGAAGMHDRYRDMRLDVDNMSYEELLALEERIGDVCTGVNEETISNRLKLRKFKSSTKSPQDAEPCCICQEEYSEGEDMGTLECGHDFHSQCIKDWLKLKNLCPICKTTGLNTAKKRKIG